MQKEVQLIDDFLSAYMRVRLADVPAKAQGLLRAMEYSLFTGGKRFRPALTLMTGRALGLDVNACLPFAAAVEMVHTYSLIHDDLPALDNDDIRRGQPTNHKVYGEAMALLAGDALLTEASRLIASHYETQPDIGLRLSRMLGDSAGLGGMIAGQVLDLAAQGQVPPYAPAELNMTEFETLLRLKTGALIQVAIEGAGVIGRCAPAEQEVLAQFGAQLGFCFQLADDLQDYNPNDPEASGYPKKIGVEKTRALLEQESQAALASLQKLKGDRFHGRLSELQGLVKFNLERKS